MSTSRIALNIFADLQILCRLQDVPLQWTGYNRSLSLEDREELKGAYVWLDWFSIPQIELKDMQADMQPPPPPPPQTAKRAPPPY